MRVRHPVLAVQLAIVRQGIVCGIQLGTALRVPDLLQRPCEPRTGGAYPSYEICRPRRVLPQPRSPGRSVRAARTGDRWTTAAPGPAPWTNSRPSGIRMCSRPRECGLFLATWPATRTFPSRVAGFDPHVLQAAGIRSELQFPIGLGTGLIHHPELCPGMGIAPEDLHDLSLQFEHFRLVKERIGHAAVVGLQSERKHRKKTESEEVSRIS